MKKHSGYSESFPENIARLYDRPQESWSIAEWSELAAWLADGWSKARKDSRDLIDECRASASLLEETLKALSDTRSKYESLFELHKRAHELLREIWQDTKSVKSDKPGRPRSINPDRDLDTIERVRQRYLSDLEKQLSMNEQLTLAFERMFTDDGVAIRPRAPDFQRKLKTIRNRISAARRNRRPGK